MIKATFLITSRWTNLQGLKIHFCLKAINITQNYRCISCTKSALLHKKGPRARLIFLWWSKKNRPTRASKCHKVNRWETEFLFCLALVFWKAIWFTVDVWYRYMYFKLKIFIFNANRLLCIRLCRFNLVPHWVLFTCLWHVRQFQCSYVIFNVQMLGALRCDAFVM